MRQLQAQPLDVLAAEVYAQSQHLAYFSRREAPRQRARVGAPVIQDLGHLWEEQIVSKEGPARGKARELHQRQRRGAEEGGGLQGWATGGDSDFVPASPLSHLSLARPRGAPHTRSRLRIVAIWESRANLSRMVQVVTVVR